MDPVAAQLIEMNSRRGGERDGDGFFFFFFFFFFFYETVSIDVYASRNVIRAWPAGVFTVSHDG